MYSILNKLGMYEDVAKIVSERFEGSLTIEDCVNIVSDRSSRRL